MDLAERAAAVGALGDPIRRALYDYVASQPHAVGREEAATALDLAPHTANFHLDRLADVGLLATEYRRLTGRSGPGAGRPSKLYRRADREWTVSLPERHYDLVGRILADGVERARAGASLADAVDEAASGAGRAVGEAASPGDVPGFVDALAGQGFEPRVDDDTVVLSNCPFDVLARTHTELVCGINQHFVQGVADGMGCEVTARLDPEPGRCCVTVDVS